MSTTTVTRPETASQPPSAPVSPVPSTAISTPEDYANRLQAWTRAHCNVLTPFVTFSALPPQHAMIASRVEINPNPAFGEVYRDELFCDEDEVAIAKNGLMKIAQAAGISIDTLRTDPRTIPNYWEFKAIGTWRGIDGVPMMQTATLEYDLRDGAPRSVTMSAKRVVRARQYGSRGAESRAINALIRQFGVKQKYKLAEIAKPFVVLRVVFQPDMNDPEQRRMLAQQAMRGTSALFAHMPMDVAPALPIIDADTVDATKPAETAKPAEPPSEYSMRVVGVEEKPWAKADKSGGVRYIVTVAGVTGAQQTYSTLSEPLATKARGFVTSGAWVDVTTERKGRFENLMDIQPAQPFAADDDGDAEGKY